MSSRRFRSEELGVAFDLDECFVDTGASADGGLPTAHFIAARPAEGWIAALALAAVAVEPPSEEEWLAQQVEAARASFEEWSEEAAVMLVPPRAASLGGRPALHLRYRLTEAAPVDAATTSGGPAGAPGAEPSPEAEPTPASLVDHWTVLVEERAWVLAIELLVQPPQEWDAHRDRLELPFRSLAII